MSYIRCGSNPEGLYVFESGSGLEFWWTDEKDQQRKVICKPSTFKQFMKKLFKQDGYLYEKPVVHKNISAQEVFVDTTKKKKYKIFKEEVYIEQMLGGKIKWHIWVCLKIDKIKILMWPVTWRYFYNNYIETNKNE